MVPKAWVRGSEDGREETELGDGGVEVWEHKVADAEEGQTSYGGGLEGGGEDEEEDLGYVVVALEIVEVWIPAEDGEDEVLEGGLFKVEIVLGLVLDLHISKT